MTDRSNLFDFYAKVRTMRDEAAAAGDRNTIEDCDLFLGGAVDGHGGKWWRGARARLLRVLDDAASSSDGVMVSIHSLAEHGGRWGARILAAEVVRLRREASKPERSAEPPVVKAPTDEAFESFAAAADRFARASEETERALAADRARREEREAAGEARHA